MLGGRRAAPPRGAREDNCVKGTARWTEGVVPRQLFGFLLKLRAGLLSVSW